jgi:hypothetical protein
MSIARVPKLRAPHQRPRARGYLTNWAREQEFELRVVWPSDESYDFYERFAFKDLRDPLVARRRFPSVREPR